MCVQSEYSTHYDYDDDDNEQCCSLDGNKMQCNYLPEKLYTDKNKSYTYNKIILSVHI